MAGALRWYVYEADDGRRYKFKCNKKNADSVVGFEGGPLSIAYVGSGFSGLADLPTTIKPRYLISRGSASGASKVKRVIVVGRRAAWDFIQSGGNITYQIFTPKYPRVVLPGSYIATDLSDITFLGGESRKITPLVGYRSTSGPGSLSN